MTRTRSLSALAVVAALVVAGCASTEGATEVGVTGTNGACTIERSPVPAGKLAFVFTNQADEVNELYVVRADGSVVGEVEDVTTGGTRTLSADLEAGSYQLRCKPGQTGDGITSDFEVTGAGGAAAAEPDRTVAVVATDFAFQVDPTGITPGTTVRFELANQGTQPHEFEVLGPDGSPIGEIASVAPGGSGAATVNFAEAGTYGYRCILVDPTSGATHAALGMAGSFVVTAA